VSLPRVTQQRHEPESDAIGWSAVSGRDAADVEASANMVFVSQRGGAEPQIGR